LPRTRWVEERSVPLHTKGRGLEGIGSVKGGGTEASEGGEKKAQEGKSSRGVRNLGHCELWDKKPLLKELGEEGIKKLLGRDPKGGGGVARQAKIALNG